MTEHAEKGQTEQKSVKGCKKKRGKRDPIQAQATTARNKARRIATHARRAAKHREHLLEWGRRKGVSEYADMRRAYRDRRA